MSRPLAGTYPVYFDKYISLVKENDIIKALREDLSHTEAFLKSIPEEKTLYRYAEGKWSIKEVLQHLIDAERIFAYRALAFSREDLTTLPSFDENSYATHSGADRRPWQDLIKECMLVRETSVCLFESFTPEQLNIIGKASDYKMSVLAMGFTIAGHLIHHVNLIKERYLG